MQETFGADEGTRSESPFMSPGELYDREDEPEFHKPKKPVIKLPKKLKAKVSPVRRRCCCGSCDIDSFKDSTVFFFFLLLQIKNMHRPDPPGATSSDYLSEAAKVGENFQISAGKDDG